MSLRDRQIGGIPLTRGEACILTVLLSFCIPIMGYSVWFPLFGIAKELRPWLSVISMCIYFAQCAGNVQAGSEQTQLFFGKYTGVSFSAGIYLLPRLPFPIISMLLMLMQDDVRKYLGWILEGVVTLESIVVQFSSEGMTSDGVRVRLEGRLVFEVTHAAVFLSQKGNTDKRVDLEEAIRAEVSSRIKQKIIAKHDVKSLFQGEYEASASLSTWITETCMLTKDFGVKLSRSPVVSVQILSERIQRAVDADSSKELLARTTKALAERFREFKTTLGSDVSEEAALMLFNAEQIDNNKPTLDMNILKFK